MSEDAADQYACTEIVLEATPEAAIVANLGMAAYNLIDIEDRDLNFLMTGGMGATTPIGLGLATTIDRTVTVLDGDGSTLMSLGALATVGTYGPSNLTIVIWNNERFETTGGQPSLAATTDFAGVAESCGVKAWQTSTEPGFERAYTEAVEHDGPAVVCCDVTSERPEGHPRLDYGHSSMKHRFRNAVAEE